MLISRNFNRTEIPPTDRRRILVVDHASWRMAHGRHSAADILAADQPRRAGALPARQSRLSPAGAARVLLGREPTRRRAALVRADRCPGGRRCWRRMAKRARPAA